MLCRPVDDRNSTERGAAEPQHRGTTSVQVDTHQRCREDIKGQRRIDGAGSPCLDAPVAMGYSTYCRGSEARIVWTSLLRGLEIKLAQEEIDQINQYYRDLPVDGHT